MTLERPLVWLVAVGVVGVVGAVVSGYARLPTPSDRLVVVLLGAVVVLPLAFVLTRLLVRSFRTRNRGWRGR